MVDVARERGRSPVRPVDFGKLLERLELGIGQAAHLCGVSIRQLSYWTDKGIIKPSERGGSRTYDYAAIEKVCLIRQGLDHGYSLEVRTYRVSGDLGRMAASLGGIEKLIAFLEANPYTVSTARQIALRVGREAEAVQDELDLLEQRRFVQKISYPGADVYRYIPPRRR